MNLICETERLMIRQFGRADTAFVIRQLNDPSFIRYIADKQVRTEEDALHYLSKGPLASYQGYGFGLNLVALKKDNTPIGMCGLLKREELAYPDLGYAFLPEYCGQGFAFEAAEAVLQREMARYELDCVQAVTFPDNLSSNKLLVKLGFHLKETMELYGLQNNLYQYPEK